MKKTVNSPKVEVPFPASIFLIAVATVALVSALLLGLAFRSAFDADIGYFVTIRHSLLPTLWIGASLILCAGVEALLLLSRKATFDGSDEVLFTPSSGLTLRVTELLLAFAFLFRSWKTLFPSGLDFSGSGIVEAVLSLGAVLYLILPVLGAKNAEWRSIPGLFWLMWCLFRIIGTYMDRTVQMNHPLKMMEEFLMFFIMLSLISEMRYFLGTAKPIRFLIFSVPALVFSFEIPVGLLIGGQIDLFRAQLGPQLFLLAYAAFVFCRIVKVALSATAPADAPADASADASDGEPENGPQPQAEETPEETVEETAETDAPADAAANEAGNAASNEEVSE